MAVTRCICHQISFRQILAIAGEKGIRDLKELQEAGICCTNCRLCAPYIRQMLESGQVRFEYVPEKYD